MHLRSFVVAGKYDGFERITKYVDCFDSLEEAFATVTQKELTNYPWCEIEIQGLREDFAYVIDCTAPLEISPAIGTLRYAPQRA